MTYCLALRLEEGLVFLADTRTNAGVDNIGSYRKLHLIQPNPQRIFVIESAGSLATTQEVLDKIYRDLDDERQETLATVNHLFEAALYLGRLSRDVAEEHREALAGVGADGTATFILGGQIGNEPPDILLVYPEGNYIRALRRAAVPPDRREQIRQVHAGTCRRGQGLDRHRHVHSPRVNDEYRSGQSLCWATLRWLRISQPIFRPNPVSDRE